MLVFITIFPIEAANQNSLQKNLRSLKAVFRRCPVKGVLKHFAIFTGKHLFWSLFLIKLQASRSLKKRLQHKCFPVNLTKHLKTPAVATSENF